MKFPLLKEIIKKYRFLILISGAWAMLVIWAVPFNSESTKFIDLIRFIFIILLISIPGHFYYLQELFKKQNLKRSPISWYFESLLAGLIMAFMGAIPIAIIIAITSLIFNSNKPIAW